jgi:high-affinity nickel-transport protein
LISLLAIIVVGFLLGMRHATDPDHVIAISTIVSREGQMKRAAWIGAAWGVGHTLTILFVGSAMILFRIVLPARVGLAMELAVGLMLIFLGLRNLAVNFGVSKPSHYHAQGDYIHAHNSENQAAHSATKTPTALMDRWFQTSDIYQWARPLVIGVVHGLAGSAAIALLVLSTIPTPRWAIVYLAVFGIGTVLGMMLITITLGSTFAYAQKRFATIGRHFGMAAGLISVAFGLFIAYQTGIVNGLFTSHATWIPR